MCRVFLWLEAFLVYIRLGTYINGILCILSARLFIDFTGIDTGKAVVEKIRKDSERNNSETQNFLLEPLLALTLTQTEAMSSLHKCDIPKQLYLSGKLGIPEAILWLYGPKLVVDNDDDEIMTNKTQGQMGLTPEIELSKPSVKQNAGDGDGAGATVSRMWVIRKNMRKSCMYLSSKVQLLQRWIRGNMISFKAHVKMVWLSAYEWDTGNRVTSYLYCRFLVLRIHEITICNLSGFWNLQYSRCWCFRKYLLDTLTWLD